MDIIEEFVVPVLCIVAVVLVLVIAPVFGLAFWLDSVSCKAQANKMGVPSSYTLTERCMIQIDGQWIPGSSYRYIGNLED